MSLLAGGSVKGALEEGPGALDWGEEGEGGSELVKCKEARCGEKVVR